MSTYNQYKGGIITMFNNCINGKITVKELIEYLTIIENAIKSTYKKSNNKGLWFRFSESDTLVTTILDIKTDLSLPKNHNNYKFMVLNIGIATKNINEFQIYFS
jgi:hypothetical protein